MVLTPEEERLANEWEPIKARLRKEFFSTAIWHNRQHARLYIHGDDIPKIKAYWKRVQGDIGYPPPDDTSLPSAYRNCPIVYGGERTELALSKEAIANAFGNQRWAEAKGGDGIPHGILAWLVPEPERKD